MGTGEGPARASVRTDALAQGQRAGARGTGLPGRSTRHPGIEMGRALRLEPTAMVLAGVISPR